MGAIGRQVDDIAQALHRAGHVKDLCDGESFFRRLTRLEEQFPSLSVLLHKQGKLPVEMFRLWSHPQLMAIAHQVLGPDVSGQQPLTPFIPIPYYHRSSSLTPALSSSAAAHPNWSLRSKTPQEEQGTVPWHQDAAYLQNDADTTLQMTAWIPFLDTNPRNGCMQVIRGGHRTGRLIPHIGCSGRTWYIEMNPAHMSELGLSPSAHTVTVPVPFGSVLLLNNLIPHRSLPNVSDDVRWSVDVRWQDSRLPSGFPAKPLLPLSRGDEPAFKPDWKLWAEQNRHVMVKPRGKADEEAEQTDPFDTTIVSTTGGEGHNDVEVRYSPALRSVCRWARG